MTRNILLMYLLVIVSLGISGCANMGPNQEATALLVKNEQPEVFAAVLTVLKGFHFQIDKADPQEGFIESKPLTGAQWFELWRHENSDPRTWLESNLHSIRRVATLQLHEEQGYIQIHCRIQIQRLNVPARPVTSSSQVYHVLSDSEPLVQHLEFTDEQEKKMHWTDLGEDDALASRILRKIQRRLGEA